MHPTPSLYTILPQFHLFLGDRTVSTMQLLWGHPCVYEKGRQFAAMIDNMDLDRNLFFGLSLVPVVSLASSPQGKLTL